MTATMRDQDPMVGAPIWPFMIPVCLTAPERKADGVFEALIDSGCTQCLISLSVINELEVRTQWLAKPLWFEQVDRSLMGGAPATHITEPIRLEMTMHWEMIHFVVVPKMTEAVILGLA